MNQIHAISEPNLTGDVRLFAVLHDQTMDMRQWAHRRGRRK